MISGNGMTRARAVGPMPYLLTWSDPSGYTVIELLTTIVQEITENPAQVLILQGIIGDGDNRTFTVLFTEPHTPGPQPASCDDLLTSGIIGLAGREDLCKTVISSLAEHRNRLPPALLLITIGGDAASILLWDTRSGETTSLTQFSSSFDRLRHAGYEPFETKRLGGSDSERVATSSQPSEPAAIADQPAEVTKPAPAAVTVQFEVPHWVWAAAFLFLAAFLAVRYGPEIWKPPQSNTPAQIRQVAHLGIQVTQRDRNLDIQWDRIATASATSGVLKVSDGEERLAIPLAPADLAAGRIAYAPRSASLSVELAIQTSGGQLNDSVRILMTQPAIEPAPQRLRPGPAAVPSPAAAAPADGPPADEESNNAAKMRFSLPGASERNPELADAPPLVDLRSTNVSQVMASSLPQGLRPPPPTSLPVPNPVAERRADQPGPAAAVTFQPPVPTKQVSPIVPNVLRQNLFRPSVIEVTVGVDAAGRVISAKAAGYSGVLAHLAGFATEAARRWRFRPALRNGQSVPSEYLIRFSFARNQ